MANKSKSDVIRALKICSLGDKKRKNSHARIAHIKIMRTISRNIKARIVTKNL